MYATSDSTMVWSRTVEKSGITLAGKPNVDLSVGIDDGGFQVIIVCGDGRPISQFHR